MIVIFCKRQSAKLLAVSSQILNICHYLYIAATEYFVLLLLRSSPRVIIIIDGTRVVISVPSYDGSNYYFILRRIRFHLVRKHMRWVFFTFCLRARTHARLAGDFHSRQEKRPLSDRYRWRSISAERGKSLAAATRDGLGSTWIWSTVALPPPLTCRSLRVPSVRIGTLFNNKNNYFHYRRVDCCDSRLEGVFFCTFGYPVFRFSSMKSRFLCPNE